MFPYQMVVSMSTGQTENQIKTTKVMEECLLPSKKNLLVLRDVSFIKLQLFVVLNDMSV
jgi:hypothetical protein